MIKKTLVIFLCITVISFPVYADVSNVRNYIVTENYSEDMFYDTEQVVQASTNGNLAPNCKSSILVEQTTGKVLYEHNADNKQSPASITKIMSLLLVMEAIENKNININDTLTCSEHASSMGGSQIWLEPGEQMTVQDLLKASVVGSANDATCVLAEAISGSEDQFVELMNQKAKQLNMNNTNFKNCTGLDEDDHYTTARDIAIMSCELLKYDLIKNYTTIWMDTLRNGQTQLVNTNKLVRFYEGATGLKTGTTNEAGCCVSASATKNNLSLVSVVLGASNSNDRFSDAKSLLNYGFANYENNLLTTKLPSKTIKVIGGQKPICSIKTNDNINLITNKGSKDQLSIEYKIAEQLEAPVKKGDVVGSVIINQNGNELAQFDIISNENIDKMNYQTAIKWLLNGLIIK